MNEVNFLVMSFNEVSNRNFYALVGVPTDKCFTPHECK